MTGQIEPRGRPLHRSLVAAARVSGVLAALLGALALADWMLLGPEVLREWSGPIYMKTNTALAMLLAGVGLLLLIPDQVEPGRRWMGRGCAAVVLLLGWLTLSEHLIGWDLGIDQLLATEPPGAAAVISPNRMGPPASLVFSLLGPALLLLSRSRRRAGRPALHQPVALAVIVVAFLPTIGYLFGADELYGIARYTGIAWPTAVALLGLGLGVLCARPQDGLMAAVTADDPGGRMIRSLLLPMVLLPLVLGWLRLAGERHGLYAAALGTSMMMLIFIVIFSALVYYAGRRGSQLAALTEQQKQLLRESEQRRIAALAASEERFRTMANAMPQLAWIATADGYIHWYNQRWYDYTGTTPEQMEGWGWQSVHDPDELPSVLKQWKASIATGEPFEMIFPLRGADRLFRPFLTRGMPFKDEQGRVQQWLGTNTDVSEQKRAEEDLRRLNDELDHRVEQRTAELASINRELEAFSYTVSHDLRAPLRHVAGFVALLNEEAGPNMDEECRGYMQNISEAAQRMGHLIDDLLMFSRIGRATMTIRPVSLRRLVDEAQAELSSEAAGRAIDWQIGPLPEVPGDPVLLRSVVVNLLSNAIKYTRHRDPARIEVGCQEQDGEVICFVRDNGAGFDMRFVDKLFGVFQRLHRLEDFEGTGIGLASVRRVIQRHGGRTWAEGETGRGATFYFSLLVEKGTGPICRNGPEGAAHKLDLSPFPPCPIFHPPLFHRYRRND